MRYAQLTEAALLEALHWRASLVWEEYRADLLAHPDAIASPEDAIRDQRVRVAIGEGRILGFSVVVPTTADAHELDGLFVDPEFMGRGIGRSLVTDAAAIARASGVSRLEVTANPRAVGFYEKVGFAAQGSASTRFGPGVRMNMDLDQSASADR